jgi:hypothetical protein
MDSHPYYLLAARVALLDAGLDPAGAAPLAASRGSSPDGTATGTA